MNYIIVTIYDGRLTVCNNGDLLKLKYGDYNSKTNGYWIDDLAYKINMAYRDSHNLDMFCKWLKETFNNYDIIIVCDNYDEDMFVLKNNIPQQLSSEKPLGDLKNAKEILSKIYYTEEGGACPQCNTLVGKTFQYCPHCGQKLDWNVEENR